MSSLNKMQFIGRLTRNPETKEFNSTSVTNFALALDDGYKGKDDQWVDRAIFVECQIWNGAGKNLADRCAKGDLIYVEGKYDPNTYEDKETGQKRTMPRFTVYTWKSLTFKKKDVDASEDVKEEKSKKKGRPAKSEKKPEASETPVDDSDDDEDSIPF